MKNDKTILLKNTIYMYAMNIIKLLFPLLTLPYLTRILSTDAYGTLTYVKSIIVYVQLVIDFGFMLSATKNIVDSNDVSDINKIIGDTIIEKIILSIIVFIVFLILFFFIPIMANNKLFCLFYLFSTLISIFILDFLYRGVEKMNYVAIPYIISKSLTTLFTFIFVKNDSGLMYIPMLDFFGNLVAAVLSFIFLFKLGYSISFSRFDVWIKDLKESFVYFVSNFATTFFGALTTIVAGIYISTSQIAFWGICMQMLSAAKALYNPITNSIYPYMIKKKDIKLVYKISYVMFIPMIFGVLFIMFFGNSFMEIVGGSKYYTAGNVLRFLLPSFVFSFYSMLFGWPVLGVINKIKETTFSTVIASIVQVLGLVILGILDCFNLYNLAICCSLSETVLFIIRFYLFVKNKSAFKKNN